VKSWTDQQLPRAHKPQNDQQRRRPDKKITNLAVQWIEAKAPTTAARPDEIT
jgi:hypothetical protein